MFKITIVTTQGCRHCQEAKKILNELQSDYDLEITEVDAVSAEGQELIGKYGILSSPGIIIDDTLFSMGGVTKQQLENKFSLK